ncbi:MAG: alpha/beta fold hydrolase [Actinomycetota bacterium]
MTETAVRTRVGKLKVSVTGRRDHPSALLWHSLFVDERSWERVTPELALDRQLVVVTGPGHGLSGDAGRRFSLEDCAEAAGEVLDAVGVEGPVDWVGNAWGGRVGIVFAARHPDRVRTLVTAGTEVDPHTRSGGLGTQWMMMLYRLFGPRLIADAVVKALLSARSRATDSSATAVVRNSLARADRAGLANAVISISGKREDLNPVLPEVKAPTLFVTGSKHPGWSPEHARAAATLLPQATTHEVDGASYLVPLESPDAFSRCVRDFWRAHPAST